MTWRDNLLPASFVGESFYVESIEEEGGRRIKETDKYKSRTITTDLGPILPKFAVTGYVIQDKWNGFDYFSDRDNLRAALNKYRLMGGLLIHPFLGVQFVHASTYRLSESFNEGGIARFEIEFLLETPEIFPGTLKDFTAIVDLQAISTLDKIADTFGAVFSTIAGAGAFIESIGQDLIFAMQKMQTAVNSVVGAVKSTINTAIGVITAAIATITSVLNAPCDIFDTIQNAAGSFRYIGGLLGDVGSTGILGGCSGTQQTEGITLDGTDIPEALGESIVTEMIAATNFTQDDLGVIPGNQQCNRLNSMDMVKMVLFVYAMQMGIRINYKSQDKMFVVLNKMNDALEDFKLEMGENISCGDNSNAFTAIQQMQTVFTTSMLEKGNELQKNINYNVPPGVESALTLAYDKYQDLDRMEEIVSKNRTKIQYPGFLPSGDTIVILDE